MITPLPVSLLMLAALGSAGGVVCLWWSWRAREPKPRLLKPLGWALLMLACLPWSRALGVEFGLAYALMVMTLAAWLLVIATAATGPAAAPEQVAQRLHWPTWRSLVRHTGLFLLVVPVAGVASALACVGAVRLLPWQPANSLTVVIVLQPLIWGALAYWFTAAPRIRRPLAASVLAGTAGAALIFL